MFHSRELNNKINNLHERALRIVYKDNKSTTIKFLGPKNAALSELKFNHGQTNCISDEILASIMPQFVPRGRTACRDGPNLHRRARFPLPSGPQPSVTSFSGEIRGADNASNLGLALFFELKKFRPKPEF